VSESHRPAPGGAKNIKNWYAQKPNRFKGKELSAGNSRLSRKKKRRGRWRKKTKGPKSVERDLTKIQSVPVGVTDHTPKIAAEEGERRKGGNIITGTEGGTAKAHQRNTDSGDSGLKSHRRILGQARETEHRS